MLFGGIIGLTELMEDPTPGIWPRGWPLTAQVVLGVVVAEFPLYWAHRVGHVVFDNECYESSRGAPTATAGQADLAAIARGAGFANVTTANSVAEFEQGFLRAVKTNDLSFVLAKVEVGAGDVPAAALDSAENKYLFVRYIEKSENLKILTSTLSRASESRR